MARKAFVWFSIALVQIFWFPLTGTCGDLVLKLPNGEGVTFVGAIQRWDVDGNHKKPVDPKAKIDAPRVDAQAKLTGGTQWTFSNLPLGRYDLVILKKGRVRVEGFHYPPVLEFDPFLPATAKGPEKSVVDWISGDIAKTPRYYNKVKPLYFAGDNKQVRLLLQLVRDQPTSYDAQVGYPVATIRHEIWQYTYRFGGWSKERSTKVLDRVLLPKKEFQQWTWVWEPTLGGINVKDSQTLTMEYRFPERWEEKTSKGWFPDKTNP